MTAPLIQDLRIETNIPTLYLRLPQPTKRDAEGLLRLFSHEYNNRFEPERPNPPKLTVEVYAEKIPKWLEMAERGENCVCVVALAAQGSDEEQVIGIGGFNDFDTIPTEDDNGTMKTSDVGIMLHHPFTGKGYGIAAMQATIQAAFDIFQVDLVTAETSVINKPFRGLMGKLKLDQYSRASSADDPEDIIYTFNKEQWENARRAMQKP